MNRGEVWWVEDPDAGRRPHLVLTRQAAIAALNKVMVAPATRTIRGIRSEVRLDEDDGMPAPCVISFDNIVTVPKSYLTSRITRLGVDRLDEVCRALSAATGC